MPPWLGLRSSKPSYQVAGCRFSSSSSWAICCWSVVRIAIHRRLAPNDTGGSAFCLGGVVLCCLAVIHCRGQVLLAQLMPLQVSDNGDMQVLRHRLLQVVVKIELPECGVEDIAASNNRCNALFDIIHHYRQLVGVDAFLAPDDKVEEKPLWYAGQNLPAKKSVVE